MKRASPFLMATYLEDLSAATCSKSSPNGMSFEAITLCMVHALLSSFVWLAYFCLPFNDLLKTLYSL